MKIHLTLFFLLFSTYCLAQSTITGRVIGQTDTKPITGANVFLSNTTIASATINNGTFTLNNIKPGKYDLVITFVGFDTYSKTITVTNGNIDLQTITLFPKSIALQGVKITANRSADPERPRYMEWFKGEFLGMSDLSRECKILNPELLDFNYDNANNVLTATSADFLIVENDALGYKIKYLLKNFRLTFDYDENHIFSYSGSVQFEPMKGTPEEEKRWAQHRLDVYQNSQMHFLRAAIAGNLDEEGFRILKVPANPERPADSIVQEKLRVYRLLKDDKTFRDSLKYWEKKAALPKTLDKVDQDPLKKDDFITGPDKSGLYAFNFTGNSFFITYNKYKHFNRSARSKLSSEENQDNTLVSFAHSKLFFDKNGSVINPEGLVYDGIWVRGRVAALLPLDYEPHDDNLQQLDSALVNKVTARVNAYQSKHLTEKAYLQFDKPYYAAGDTMYFKAYVTTGETHQLSHLSGVLYADLINPHNRVSNSIRMLIIDGVAWGDFALPRNMGNGSYRVRAYTQWMRNAGNESFFDKTIAIGSPLKDRIPESAAPAPSITDTAYDTQFMPEGGSLIAGCRSKIAFKAIGSNGLGVAVKGEVFDGNNKHIVSFAASHLGMGFFYLTPETGKTYTAKIDYPDGKHDVIPIPEISENGINFAFTDLTRSYAVKVNCSKQWFQQNKDKNYTLIVYSDSVPQSETFKLTDPEITFDIVKNDLHTGIATATLFSSEGEPLCERLLFVRTNDLLALDIKSDKSAYAIRSKTALTLDAITGENGPAAGHFSVAVIDETKVPVDENSASTLVNNLLLTSDLKGYIEQPNYYFTNITDKTNADLDLVMLTHGYRKFDWKKILGKDDKLPAYKVEKGLSISGRVIDGGKPVINGTVKLFSKGANGLMLDTLSDHDGRFIFDNLDFTDSTKFVLQARTSKGKKDVDVKPDTLVSLPEINPGKYALQPDINIKLANYLGSDKTFLDEKEKDLNFKPEGQLLKEVVIKEKKVSKFEHSDNLNGKGNADQVLTADDLEKSGYTNLYDALKSKIREVTFTDNHRIRSSRSTLPITFKGIKPDYMLVIVDGTPFFNTLSPDGLYHGVLDDFEASDIESVEVLLGTHGAAIYGSQASGGAIIVTTKRGRQIDHYYKEAPGVITFKANGFYKARDFYAPKYEHLDIADSKPDLRSTIYWNPEFITDRNGKATIAYYNADSKGTYRVEVEGIDAEGNLGRQVFRYKVE
ncbi:MAG TPA: carboxypeptidase regulatory-like domain-containing protein [Mucilaginibacter sp.]|nr:carboxypeptidase regulatory-like domain-containing protein [Mucilaginibacter sp.]